MRLIDADKVNVVEYAGLVHIPPDDYLGLCAFFKKQLIDEQPTINPDDLRPQGRYRIDGHHIRFKCCDKVLSIVPNESDDYENLVSCPFCNAKMDGKGDGE